ncbi:MAG: glycoside hydrolase family 2 protein [Candidatus Lokiarchaeota archaeon]|nr:glycoside hydrolase family 2 protein [Candidatus Lokiarchaeota archaeon]
MIKPVRKLPLNDEWQLIQKERNLILNCSVPTTVFEALIERNIIPDPFYGLEEKNADWVYESDWIYEKWFDVDPKLLSYSTIILRFYGLDTIVEIRLNGELLGKTQNMFRRYEFDVKPLIKSTDNHLMVEFTSPTKIARYKICKSKDRLTTGRKDTAIEGIPYIRKAQYSFGWDWGPKLPDIGIWKPIELIFSDNVSIQSIHPRSYFYYDKQFEDGNKNYPTIKLVKLEIDTVIDSRDLHNYVLQVRLFSPLGKEYQKNKVTVKSEEIFELLIEDPELWWCHDLGEPSLYTLEVSLADNYTIIDTKTLTLGLRDIQLIRNADKWGETFYFRLNGIPIFGKGANWIPIDSFISRGKKRHLYQMNLQFAKEANFNLIRVWGGGIYEDDEFYDLCDHLGLLIWQDFPFACALYPLFDPDFLANIKEETIENIIRLRHHACLALWCGNNEIEALFDVLLVLSRVILKKRKYKRSYIEFFEKILPQIINQYDPQHDYWPSSPSKGGFSGKIKASPLSLNKNNYGDRHYWGVWHGGRPFSSYRKQHSRFMSEYGFESFPNIHTIQEFCPKDQMNIFSPIMENHQKNSAGNKKILNYMRKRFSMPKEFEKQVILSQITQAEAMKYGVEHWRRYRNDLRCMGSLYWQLNDCWPVASWSSLDYFGRWKALHFFARRFYAPLLPIILDQSNNVEFWVVNDTKSEQMLAISYCICDSKGIILSRNKESTEESHLIPALSSKLILIQEFKNKPRNKNQLMIIVRMKDDEGKIYENFHLLGRPKDLQLQKPDFRVELIADKSRKNSCRIHIMTDKVAPYVFIESTKFDLIPSDNFFLMEPNYEKTIEIKLNPFLQKTETTTREIFDSLRIKSLWDLRDS